MPSRTEAIKESENNYRSLAAGYTIDEILKSESALPFRVESPDSDNLEITIHEAVDTSIFNGFVGRRLSRETILNEDGTAAGTMASLVIERVQSSDMLVRTQVYQFFADIEGQATSTYIRPNDAMTVTAGPLTEQQYAHFHGVELRYIEDFIDNVGRRLIR